MDEQTALEHKLATLPVRPGVYLFRDADGAVLYIGKAKSLRSRVRSYFQSSNSDERLYLPALVSQVHDVETIVTATEKEAAILENSLVKERQPRFNVKLRDDKEFLTLRLDPTSTWPKLELVRRAKTDGARYFGPYHSATSARRTLHLVEKHFRLRTCSDREMKNRKRPCLQYQIQRCPGPCVMDVDNQEYARQVHAVGLFLDGRHDELSRELEQRMQSAKGEFEYELAATYRDQLFALQSIREKQSVVSVTDLDQDVVGLYREGDLIEIATLNLRAGRVIEASSFSKPRVQLSDDEIVAAYLREQYADDGAAALIPDEIVLPVRPEGADGIAEWLSDLRTARAERRGARVPRRVQLTFPERGKKLALLNLALENAAHSFAEKRRRQHDVEGRLERLGTILRLSAPPRHIECTDISHLGGEDTVGSLVVLTDGVPDRRRYRTFRLKAATEGDDYAAMYEVLSRRFRRGKEAEVGQDWELPDLFVVDGGRGQLAVALTAARDLGLFDLQIVGLAKERETVAGGKLTDRVYLPGQKNPIALRPNSPELFLLALARDEAHRFANRGRRRAGSSRRFSSELDRVVGIGPATKRALLTAFGSLENALGATDEEILALRGVHRGHLRALRSPSLAAAAEESSGSLEGEGER
jgi:excinuclease ABC subunit C